MRDLVVPVFYCVLPGLVLPDYYNLSKPRAAGMASTAPLLYARGLQKPRRS